MQTFITIAAILLANAICVTILLIATADDLRAPSSAPLPGALREGGAAMKPCAAHSLDEGAA